MIKTVENELRVVVGITQGDINGISYEVILKSLSDNRLLELFVPVLYGSNRIASYYKKMMNIPEFGFHIVKSADQIHAKKANLFNLHDNEVKVDVGDSTAIAGEQALLSLNIALADLQNGKIDVLVTSPLNKKNVQQSIQGNFSGHTGYLAQKMNCTEYLMLMVTDNIRIGVATEHISIENVPSTLTVELLIAKIRTMEHSLKKDFRIRKPKIAVLGLNPHAGDNGLIGREEQEKIIPAIEKAQNQGTLAFGPYSADGFFASQQYKEFDAVLAMYHDQGMIPFKLMAFENGVNYTAGLPFVRTSPAHGTAYDIAGKDLASPDSMRAAMYLAVDIYNNRLMWDELNKNPLGSLNLEKENHD